MAVGLPPAVDAGAIVAAGPTAASPRGPGAPRGVPARPHRVLARPVPARHQSCTPCSIRRCVSNPRERWSGAPDAGRLVPVRESARTGAARVPQAAGAAPDFRFDALLDPRAWSSSSTRPEATEQRTGVHRASRTSPAGEDAADGQPAHARASRTASATNGNPPPDVRPVRRRSVPERQRPQRLVVLGGRDGAGHDVGGGLRHQLRDLRRQLGAPVRPTRTVRRGSVPRAASTIPGGDSRAADPRSGGHRRAFFAVAIWGVIDAVRNFKQEVRSTANGNGGRPTHAPPASDNFRLTLSPTGLGAA